MDALVGTKEAARLLGRNREVVRRYLRAGLIPSQQIGGSYVLRWADVLALAERLPKPGRPRTKRRTRAKP